MSVDIHHHMLTPRLVEALEAHGVHTIGGEPLPSWKPEVSLAVMDRMGIERAVLPAQCRCTSWIPVPRPRWLAT